MTINTREHIPNTFHTFRRNITRGIIDTTRDTNNNIANFMSHMRVYENHSLPTFILEQIPADWHIEYALEKVRQGFYSEYPSRLSCTYLSLDISFSSYKHSATLINQPKVIKCDMGIINFLRRSPYGLQDPLMLRNYWEGKSLTEALNSPNDLGALWEYLVEGEVELSY